MHALHVVCPPCCHSLSASARAAYFKRALSIFRNIDCLAEPNEMMRYWLGLPLLASWVACAASTKIGAR